ncbi:MAG TPA: GGDEF domain-containing protein [Gallionella sp.]|nr:GGDEF domain-containing protein [Gallionella sp.]
MSKNSRKVAWMGVLMVPLFWLSDAAIDVYLFGLGELFHHGLFSLEPMELYMRLLVSVMFVAFGIYAAFLLDRAERVEHSLRTSNDRLRELKEELERMSVVDPLTGVFNRRKFHDVLDISIANAVRHYHRFALLMMDIDHFKRINDEFGHQSGDGVLRIVCELIHASIRGSDQLFRVGGEEFCLVAMVDGEKDAHTLAEKVRKVVESHTFPEIGRLTISIGIASFEEGDSQESIYARADAALYEAKHNGRNCVASSDSDSAGLAFEMPG